MRNISWPILAIFAVGLLFVGGLLILDPGRGRDNITGRDTSEIQTGIGGGPPTQQDQSTTVTTEGEVVRVLAPGVFVIREGTVIQTERLVLSNDVNATILEGDRMSVTGVAKVLNALEIESELGMELEDDVEEEFRGKIVIVATSFRVL